MRTGLVRLGRRAPRGWNWRGLKEAPVRQVTRLVAVLASATLALTACGGGDTNPTTASSGAKSDVKVGLAYDIGGRGDQSFNDSAALGLDKAKKDLGVQAKELEASAGETDAQKAERLRLLAQGGYNPVVAVGFAYATALGTVAKEFPDTQFAIVDDSSLKNANVTSLVFAEEQGSFLVGTIAAQASKTGTVGFIGGVYTPLILKFEAGYTAGVKSIDPSIKIDVQYLTEDPNDGKTGFENPTGGKDAASAMYEDGADVVYHAAGKSGLGVFDAVEAAGKGKWAIGVDSDQYLTVDDAQKPHILTSMLKRIDTAVFDYVKANADKAVKPGFVSYDLKSEGVGYSKSGGFVDDISDKIDAAADKIKSGEIVVPTDPAKVK
jgi:basic membrane protein A